MSTYPKVLKSAMLLEAHSVVIPRIGLIGLPKVASQAITYAMAGMTAKTDWTKKVAAGMITRNLVMRQEDITVVMTKATGQTILLVDVFQVTGFVMIGKTAWMLLTNP